MQTEFQKKWERVSQRQKSLIVAGCDPAVGTPNIVDWCKNYIEKVDAYVAGIKPKTAYFQSVEGIKALKVITDFCKQKDLVSIVDYKISDIGSTNEAWIKYAVELGFDAITIAPYAGNIKETIDLCKKNNIAPIMMGLMSNPEFIQETDFVLNDKKLWKYRVETAIHENVDSLVLGGTYKKDNQLLQDFLEVVKDKPVIFLIPGIGAQGGTIEDFLATGVEPTKCMLNVGRALMNPATTYEEEAKKLQQQTEKYFG